MTNRLWPEVRAIDWTRLPGAYGVDRDVAAALETLRFGSDAEDDDFSDAWLDVLLGHVWHQGDIYPVTSHALPFVFDIVDQSPALADPTSTVREEIANAVLLMASSARHALTSYADEERASGEAVLSVLAAHTDRLRAWMTSDLHSTAIAAMLHVPELGARLLEGKEDANAKEVLSAVLKHSMWLEGSALEWAARELARIDHPVTQRASQLLFGLSQRPGSNDADSADRIAALGGAIAKHGDPTTQLDELRESFGCAVPTKFVRPGETEAQVVMVEDDWFVVQTERGFRLTIRWEGHPFVEGDRIVLVDINERNVPRAVHGTGAKAQFNAAFDDRGSRVPPP
ncbi:MAG TPA: hypothetical protein VM925_38165 [Labilithrix sp.]|nr:hypothetical protein [Labilithrix sp.]